MKKNMLFVGSHPDDIELGCLGTIMHYRKKDKANMYCIIVSDGEAGNADRKKFDRVEESITCLTGAGVKKSNIKFLHLPDRQLEMHQLEIVQEVESMCKEKSINWVVIQTNQDTHQDHRTVHSAALSGARDVENILIYESNSSTSTSYSPTYFVDISSYINEKMKLLEHHKSQVDRKYMKVDSVVGLARYRGSQSRNAPYAEAFEVFRLTEMPDQDNGSIKEHAVP